MKTKVWSFLHLVLILFCLSSFTVSAASPQQTPQPLYYCGKADNDLYKLLRREGFNLLCFSNPAAAIVAASKGAGVLITAKYYPELDTNERISQQLLERAAKEDLKLYIEYPAAFPGLNIPDTARETHLARAVVCSDGFDAPLQRMSLIDINDCHVLEVKATDPLIVLAKVVGVDKAVFGLTDTKVYPLLFKSHGALLAMTSFSNFEKGRYGPQQSIKSVIKYIIGYLTGQEPSKLGNWKEDVHPTFGPQEKLPENARLSSIIKGVEWFDKGRFLLDSAWKEDWIKYGSNGLKPVGPPVSQSKMPGDGSLGILEGQTATIYYNGDQQYRYWIRADVQGETSMALAAAGELLHNPAYSRRAANLLNFLFHSSNLRAGKKNDPASPVYGLIGWATTNSGTFYGDDNSRAILGAIGASGYLKTDKWDKDIAAAIIGNFRTTGKDGFRGDRLEQADIIKNGWQYYFNREVVNPSPFFESWLWACYLWLYDKTGYKPLLERTEKAIRITMDDYPDKWRWGSSMQAQRARIILPLAWLVRVSNTPEHRRWLDKMVKELLQYQAPCGAIREQLGRKGGGMFKELKKNSDYGSDEGSLIYRNGQKISCMLYTNNFALFALHEAATATGNPLYLKATQKLSQFLIRIQVSSKVHNDLDGAWFRAFDYGKWDYWASNSDAGWGAWCTLTGWIQSWILTSQVQITQGKSYWDLTKDLDMREVGNKIIQQMIGDQGNG